jgi:hypothetical protein
MVESCKLGGRARQAEVAVQFLRMARQRAGAVRLTAVVLWVVASGCNQGSNVGSSRAVGASKQEAGKTVEAKQLMQRGGVCEVNRRVSNPPPDSPEWVIWRMYQVAMEPDTDETFEKFLALFPQGTDRRHVRETYWGRVRKNVGKFAVEAGKADFVICRTTPRDNGVAYYINSADPRQYPPPIVIGQADGGHRIVHLTPF